MSVRRFPMPRWPNRGDGWCTWCGESVQRPARTWHRPCLAEYQLHTSLVHQRAFVAKRDGNVCLDCGSRPSRWIRGIVCYRPDDRGGMTKYTPVRRACALQLEHETPLWKVAALPADERRAYFGPGNLRLLCPDCHKVKSRREAGERAAARRPQLQLMLEMATGCTGGVA